MKQLWQQLLNLFRASKVKDKEEISILIWTEKKVGHGEDAPPLLVRKGKACAVGVFDGMGGAGATTCNSSIEGEHTQAYVSSRIVCTSMDIFLQNHLPTDDVDVKDMKEVIMHKLREEKEAFPPKVISSLRSKLVRDYPTTLAIVTLQEYEKTYQVDSYWAGDSHCYLWTKSGFFQISKDDLEDNNDPMENLHNDSPISNCICADRDFVIHHNPITLAKEPVIILCATDGCFGYYPTPMHFEYLLKSCLQEAENKEEWETKIINRILKVTGDDSSLSMIAVGFSSFGDLKKSMKDSAVEGFPKLLKQEETISYFEKELAYERERYEQNVATGWGKYKTDYMKYINDEDNGNA